MTHQYTVSSYLHCTATGVVTLPEGKSWDDIGEWYVKWDTLHFEIDGKWHERPLGSETNDGTDWKHPVSVDIYEGNFEFDHEVASTGG